MKNSPELPAWKSRSWRKSELKDCACRKAGGRGGEAASEPVFGRQILLFLGDFPSLLSLALSSAADER